MMNINRNTINGDIDHLYSKILTSFNQLDPEPAIILNIQRLNVQRSRLRESLDKADNFQQRLAIEKMIFDIDCKIIYTELRIAESLHRIQKLGVDYLNDWLKDNKRDERYVTCLDTMSINEKTKQKISKIIREDRKKIQI